MQKEIENYIFSLNPDIVIQAPSRINLINPLDAVEADYWMPSVAINGVGNPLSTFVYIKKRDNVSIIKFYRIKIEEKRYLIEIEFESELIKNKTTFKKNFNSELKLIYASIYRFSKTSCYFWKKFLEENIEIGIITTIPRQSGLGGSASIIIALLYGFGEYFNIYNNINCLKKGELPINKDIIAEMATKVEDEDLKITAGYSDRYTISRGGLCFNSYSGKLLHKKITKEPLAIYDRLDEVYNIKELPIIICFSGVLHDSGTVHEKLRRLYLRNEPKIIRGYKNLAKIAWKSRFALMKQDWKLLGEFFKKNTKIMNKIMVNAGFMHGIGLANNFLIKLIQDHPDVFAVKLTGAGGGGSVFALTDLHKIDKVLTEWKNRLLSVIRDENTFRSEFPFYPLSLRTQLRNAKFYRIKIDINGVKKL